jgi:hypothetical protein
MTKNYLNQEKYSQDKENNGRHRTNGDQKMLGGG